MTFYFFIYPHGQFVDFFDNRKPNYDPGEEAEVLGQFRDKMMQSFDAEVVRSQEFVQTLDTAEIELREDGSGHEGHDLDVSNLTFYSFPEFHLKTQSSVPLLNI